MATNFIPGQMYCPDISDVDVLHGLDGARKQIDITKEAVLIFLRSTDFSYELNRSPQIITFYYFLYGETIVRIKPELAEKYLKELG